MRRPYARCTLLATLVASLVCLTGPTVANAASYFVSSSTGSDSNPGTQAQPWQTLGKVNGFALAPGDQVQLLRGDTWTGGLTLTQSGTSTARISVFGYGTSPSRPKITGGLNGDCIKTTGSFLTVDNLQGTSCGYAGVQVYGTDTTIKNGAYTNNAVGIHDAASTTANVLIDSNTLTNNNILNVNNSSSSSGAFGILLNGPAVVTNNTISGSYAPSQAYVYDGSGIEIYGTGNAWVHNNVITDNDTGIEMGSTGTNNSVEYNKITGNLGSSDPQTNGIVLPGSMTSTWISHNSIDELGATSQGIVCYSTCAASDTITSNAIKATTKALYVDNPPTVQGNVFNGTVQGVTPDSTNSTAAIQWTSPPADLTEQAASPTIDHATVTNLTADLAGNPVPDAAGTPSDSGAYEFGSAAGGATLTETPTTVVAGGTITVSWTGVANPTVRDWIGLYHPGDSSGPPDPPAWLYDSSCNQTPGANAAASGSCSFMIPANATGTYELRLLPNDGYSPTLATTSQFTVTTGGGGGSASVTAPSTGTIGSSVNVSWSGITGPTTHDWIGIYPTGAADTSNGNGGQPWFYTSSCTQTAGTTTPASGTCAYTLPASLTPGTYEFRLFPNDVWTPKLATSGTITLSNAGGDTTPPSTPTGLNVTNPTQTSLTLGWTASTDNVGVTGYDTFVNGTSNGTVTTTSKTFTGLACGTSYTLGVQAFDAAGNKSGTATAQGTTSSCGGGGGAPTHVVLISMENQDYNNIYPAQPFETGFANGGALATHYYGTGHFSLDNYIAATSGITNQGLNDSCFGNSLNVNNIFSQLGAGNAINYEESGAACRHEPAAQYSGTAGFQQLLPGAFDSNTFNAKLTWITPTDGHNGHDNGPGGADSYLSGLVPRIKATPQYTSGSLAIVIWYDESNVNDVQGNTTPPDNHVYVAINRQGLTATQDATQYTHCSLLGTIEDMFGQARLGCAVGAGSMHSDFGF